MPRLLWNLAGAAGSSECGTYMTVMATFWPWLPGKRALNVQSSSRFARQILAALAHRHVPKDEATDLLNVLSETQVYEP